MKTDREIEFGDIVRIVDTELTQKLDLAGKTGDVFGLTIPESSGVEDIIGEVQPHGMAINVFFDDLDEGIWFADYLVELLRKDAGITISIEGRDFTRNGKTKTKEKLVFSIFSKGYFLG